MGRIIFVGLHNKPGKMPLCSSTKSDKLINRIIKEGRFSNSVLKTNLYDIDKMPSNDELFMLGLDWIDRVSPEGDDIIVLLGRFVHDHFPPHSSIEIKVAHPASKRSHKEMNEYVADVIKKIKSNKNEIS